MNYLKYVSLLVLTVQTTTMVMLLRYSRINYDASEGKYLSSTAIACSETIKLIVSLMVLMYSSGSFGELRVTLREEVVGKPLETLKLLIPALLYVIQNNLLFIALTNLDAATYQVTYQLKILTTALFSVAMLRKRLAVNQWLSLVLLMIGVILVQWPDNKADSETVVEDNGSLPSPQPLAEKGNRIIGLLAVLASCFSSGFSGVYFEKLVKFTSQSLWIRNVQLALFSVLLSLTAVFLQDFDDVYESGFFQGYTVMTWLVILLQAFGGLVVALVMKYADNILKGFATSISIVLSTLCSYYLIIDFEPTQSFIIGATIVISANILFRCLDNNMTSMPIINMTLKNTHTIVNLILFSSFNNHELNMGYRIWETFGGRGWTRNPPSYEADFSEIYYGLAVVLSFFLVLVASLYLLYIIRKCQKTPKFNENFRDSDSKPGFDSL